MSIQNQVYLTGNLGADPEFHQKGEESPGVLAFSLAENVTRYNEEKSAYETVHTNWHPVRAFGSLAARARAALKKGDRVSVSGRIRTFQYETKAGETRYGFEVHAEDITRSQLLPRAEAAASAGLDYAAFEGR
jgi:single-strand DNA-binding protein